MFCISRFYENAFLYFFIAVDTIISFWLFPMFLKECIFGFFITFSLFHFVFLYLFSVLSLSLFLFLLGVSF